MLGGDVGLSPTCLGPHHPPLPISMSGPLRRSELS